MAETKKEKILLIEADTASSDQISKLLKEEGYTVIATKTGEEGVKAMFDNLPHLILVDVTLPDMDGYQVLVKKQAEGVLAKIPVFLVSTQGTPINMQSVPQGSVTEFIVTIHMNPEEVLSKVNDYFHHESLKKNPNTAGQKKILWVEDDKLIGTILAKKIVSSGFQLFHAKNGEEALEILKTNKPDVIVVDLLLPGMSGFDILQKIQMDEKTKKIPSMVLSNLSKPSDIEKARVLGAQKFLVKAATSLDQIVAEIKEVCK